MHGIQSSLGGPQRPSASGVYLVAGNEKGNLGLGFGHFSDSCYISDASCFGVLCTELRHLDLVLFRGSTSIVACHLEVVEKSSCMLLSKYILLYMS